MKLGQSIGHKHGSKLAQCATADWRIRRRWRSINARVDCCRDRPGRAPAPVQFRRPDRLSLPVRAPHSRLAQSRASAHFAWG